jgi:FkbM family methyltransferase
MYLTSLGIMRGTAAYVICNFSKNADKAVHIKIRELRSPLMLRARTADVAVFEQVYVDRSHDVETSSDPHLIIDGGAHIGCVTVFLASRFPSAMILALEPEPSNFAILCENVAAYPNVTPIRAALWSKPTIVTVENPEADSWMFRMRQGASAESELTVGLTLDELLRWCGASKIDILKLDIEGAEKDLFDAAGVWLNCVQQIRVELHDRLVPGCREAIERATKRHRFLWETSGEYVILRRMTS